MGPWSNPSMTWEDVWEKYEAQIVEQEIRKAEAETDRGPENGEQNAKPKKSKPIDEEELMMRIYMRILEKSCATNQAFDGIFLKDNGEDDEDLAAISSQLEEDIHSILLSPDEAEKVMKRRGKIEKKRMKAREKEEKLKRKLEKRRNKLDNRPRNKEEESNMVP